MLTSTLDGASVVCDAALPIVRSWYKTPRDLLLGRFLTPVEKAVFLALLDIWNCASEAEWFPATNKTVSERAGVQHIAFLRARDALIAKQVIQTKPGMRRLPCRYHLSPNVTTTLKRKALPLNTSTSLVSSTKAYHKGDTL